LQRLLKASSLYRCNKSIYQFVAEYNLCIYCYDTREIRVEKHVTNDRAI